MKSPFLLFSLPLYLTGVASAQLLPAPAPVPAQTKPAPLTEPLLEDPEPFEAPIIIGEPVRKQSGMAVPMPAATPNAPRPSARASVAGISITGLSDGAAVAKLRAALSPALKEPVRLVIGGYQYTFLREELGASLPLWPLMRQARTKGGESPLRLQIDSKKLVAALQELDAQVRADFEKTALNVGGSATRIKLALESAPVPETVTLMTNTIKAPEIPVKKAEEKPLPDETTTPITKSGRFPFLMTRFSTSYDAGLRGRTTNLKMAAKLIDGTVVLPGRTFSTNLAIGPRNAAAGWREAKMFVSGRVVSGTGAGICQAASTLYNAALLGNFPIIERHAHSMRVMYVPPSRDAALMWGSKDFKFRNTSSGAIRVQTSVSGGQFHVAIWGQKPGEKSPVRIVSRVLSRAGGTRSEAYKIVGDQKIRLSRDSYKPHP